MCEKCLVPDSHSGGVPGTSSGQYPDKRPLLLPPDFHQFVLPLNQQDLVKDDVRLTNLFNWIKPTFSFSPLFSLMMYSYDIAGEVEREAA